jgi:enoyl-CoA hydratase/carnithine racemase
MGISQGARVRIVTEHTKMAMPETNIGLFPDVGGGYFLSRCPGHIGEYLALTGDVIGADEALAYGLADVKVDAARQPALWDALGAQSFASTAEVEQWIATELIAKGPGAKSAGGQFDPYFSLERVKHIVDALEASSEPWAIKTAATLRKRSPLMLHVTLEQIRRARGMSLADNLRMERDMVYQCFHLRPGASSETVEGIRALAIDKDYKPQWMPGRIEDVKPGMADAFFVSPWAADEHPLRGL